MTDALRTATISAASPKNCSGWKPAIDAYCPVLVKAAAAAAKFVADMEAGSQPRWLTLLGKPGTGKTMLAKAIYEQARRINPGNPVNNSTWPPNWADSAREGINIYSGRRPYALWFDEHAFGRRIRTGEYELAEDTRDDFFVAYDDLGVARDPTNFLADKIQCLAERRLNRWTVWTSNLSLAEIAERIDGRLASRIPRDDNAFLVIDCGDYALRP